MEGLDDVGAAELGALLLVPGVDATRRCSHLCVPASP